MPRLGGADAVRLLVRLFKIGAHRHGLSGRLGVRTIRGDARRFGDGCLLSRMVKSSQRWPIGGTRESAQVSGSG